MTVHERGDRFQRGALKRLERLARVLMGTQGGLVLEERRLAVRPQQLDHIAVLLVRNLRLPLDERQVRLQHLALQLGVVDVGQRHVLGHAQLVEHARLELFGQDQPEVLGAVCRRLLLDVAAPDQLLGDRVVEHPILGVPAGAEALVQHGDDVGQRLGFGLVHLAGATEDRHHLADGAVQGDRPLEGLLQLQVGQLHVGVHRHRAVGLHERSEGLAVQVVPLQLDVGKRHHLRQKRVGAHEAAQVVAEPLLFVLLEVVEKPVDRRRQRCVDSLGHRGALGQQQVDGPFDLFWPQHPKLVQRMAGVVEQVGVGRRRHRLAVPGLERRPDVVGVVAKVQHERAVLADPVAVVGAVETRQRLHGGQAVQRLVDVHRIQLRLVEPGLVLLGHHQDLPLAAVELGGGLTVGEAVHRRLGLGATVQIQRARERHQHPDVGVALVVHVLAQRQHITGGVLPRRRHHHRLGHAPDAMGDVLPEVLDDHLGLLGQRVLVQRHKLGDRRAGFARVEVGVVRRGVLDVPVGLVGDVAGQHVEDEPLLDRLTHRVQVKGDVLPKALVHHAEQLQRAGLRRGGERKERQVRLFASRRCCGSQCILGRVRRLVRVGRARCRPQHFFQLGGRVAGLAAVGLVHDHRVGAVGQRVDLVDDVRKLLQRRDDDAGLLAGERLGQLGGVLVDALHHAVHVLKLVNGVLQLLVEHPPVGDHHHLVEHLLVGVVVQRRQSVRQPGDRVALARSGRVLHQVVVTGTVAAGSSGHGQHGIPLVEAGEDGDWCLLLRTLRCGLDVDEPVQQVQPGVALPHPFPQVGGAVPARVGRIARSQLVTPVEREKPGGLARQAGRHRRLFGVDGEVHHRPTQQRVLRIPVVAVLLDGLRHRLPGQAVLQLGRRNRHPVDEQAQVQRLVGSGLVGELPGDGQPVFAVALDQLGRQTRCRPKERQLDRLAQVDDAVTQHVHRAPFVLLLGYPVGELLLGLVDVAAVERHKLVPLGALGGADEPEQLGGVQRPHHVEVRLWILRIADLDGVVPARAHQPVADELLKRCLVHVAHAATPGISSSPVTAAVINACRRSASRSICLVNRSTMPSTFARD